MLPAASLLRIEGGGITIVTGQIKNDHGDLLGNAILKVTIVKHARFLQEECMDLEQEVEITGRIERNLREAPLADLVAEGATPYGTVSETVDAALTRATFQGMPVVKLGRGNTEGFVGPERADLWIAGSNLTATKARLLLMACLLRFGSLPPAVDAQNPTQKVGTYSIRSYELPEASILGKSNHRTTAYVDQMFDKSAID